MFTGIIEALGKVEEVARQGTNQSFWISSPFTGELRPDQSLSHNGICLTVEAIRGNAYQVTTVAETLAKTNAGDWKTGDIINLERAMLMNGRLDGHLVQGHVDARATCLGKKDMNGSWLYQFSFPAEHAALIIEKGSITVNGISLTAFNVEKDRFSVAIIPFTFEHTNMPYLEPGQQVNLEFDMIGKYVQRMSTFARP